MDVAVYNARIMGADPRRERRRPCLPHGACAIAGVAHITFPVDLQEQEARASARSATCRGHTSEVCRPQRRACRTRRPAPGRRGAERRQEGRDPRRPRRAGRRRTSSSRSPRCSARRSSRRCSGKAAVPDDSPYTTGGIGLLGTRPSQEAMEECDTLLMVGTSFPYIEFLPEAGAGAGVQIDLDPTRIGLRYPVEVGLVGDSAAHARGAAAAAAAQGGPQLPGAGAGGHAGVAGADGGARHAARTRR